MTSAGLLTEPGHGVVVANDGISTAPRGDLVGNPNFVRPAADGGGSVVVDTNTIDTPESVDKDPSVLSESEALAGIDAAVLEAHADVINESYGYSNSPGSYAIHYAANDAAVDAGVTVVASSGGSGVSGTVSSPASDPKIIAAGATNTHRLNAMAYGFTGWVNNDMTPLSSGGTTPDNKLVDLVAPGYGGEAACNPHGSDCRRTRRPRRSAAPASPLR